MTGMTNYWQRFIRAKGRRRNRPSYAHVRKPDREAEPRYGSEFICGFAIWPTDDGGEIILTWAQVLPAGEVPEGPACARCRVIVERQARKAAAP